MRLSVVLMLKPNNPIQLFSLSTSWQAATLRRVLLSQGTMFFLKTTLVVLLMTSLFNAPGLQAAEDKAQPILPRVDLKIAGKTLSAELASSPNQRFMGLNNSRNSKERELIKNYLLDHGYQMLQEQNENGSRKEILKSVKQF